MTDLPAGVSQGAFDKVRPLQAAAVAAALTLITAAGTSPALAAGAGADLVPNPPPVPRPAGEETGAIVGPDGTVVELHCDGGVGVFVFMLPNGDIGMAVSPIETICVPPGEPL